MPLEIIAYSICLCLLSLSSFALLYVKERLLTQSKMRTPLDYALP